MRGCERQVLTDKVKFRLGEKTVRSQAFSTVCQWDKMVFSPPHKIKRKCKGGEREFFPLPLSSHYVVTNEKSFQKKRSTLSENTSGHGSGNRSEPIWQSWSAVWLKHRVNCTKIKRPNLQGHLYSVQITVSRQWGGLHRFGTVDIFMLSQNWLTLYYWYINI